MAVDKRIKKEINKITAYLFFTVVCILALYIICVDTLPVNIPYLDSIPVRDSYIAKTKTEISTRINGIEEMNEKLREISLREPELRESAEELSRNSIFMLSRSKDRVVDIPSILVYLEQTGKNTGIKVNRIDILPPEDSGGLSKQVLTISAAGSYLSFIDYLREIQINTREMIAVEGFRLDYADPVTSIWNIEIKISL